MNWLWKKCEAYIFSIIKPLYIKPLSCQTTNNIKLNSVNFDNLCIHFALGSELGIGEHWLKNRQDSQRDFKRTGCLLITIFHKRFPTSLLSNSQRLPPLYNYYNITIQIQTPGLAQGVKLTTPSKTFTLLPVDASDY